jgi:hypothetical protein
VRHARMRISISVRSVTQCARMHGSGITHATQTLDMPTLDVCVDLESYPCLQHVMFPGQAVWL